MYSPSNDLKSEGGGKFAAVFLFKQHHFSSTHVWHKCDLERSFLIYIPGKEGKGRRGHLDLIVPRLPPLPKIHSGKFMTRYPHLGSE